MSRLNLSNLERGRGIARALQGELAGAGHEVALADCLDLVAGMLGFRDWDDLAAGNDPTSPHAFDHECDVAERGRRRTLQERVLVAAGITLADARRILDACRPTAGPGSGEAAPGPFGAMAGRMSLLGWDVFPEDPDAPGVALDGWEPRMPMDAAPDEVRSANVGLRLGRARDGIFAVRLDADEAANLEGMDLARSILGETPFVLVGPLRRVTMLYRKAGDPPASEAFAGGWCGVMGTRGTVTAYGTLPGTRHWRKWLRAHPVTNGPAAAPLTDDAALSRFRAALR